MRIIAFRTLREFYEKPEYTDSEVSLRAWYHEAKTAEWKNSNDLKKQYKNASIVGDGKVVFNHCCPVNRVTTFNLIVIRRI